jgi:hypothetical protein
MEAEDLLMFTVSSQDFLPASNRQLREQSDKPLGHTCQLVACQYHLADYDAKQGVASGISPFTPDLGALRCSSCIPELGRTIF